MLIQKPTRMQGKESLPFLLFLPSSWSAIITYNSSVFGYSVTTMHIENGNLLHDFSQAKPTDGSRLMIVDIAENGNRLLLMKRSDTKEEIQLCDITDLNAAAEGSSLYRCRVLPPAPGMNPGGGGIWFSSRGSRSGEAVFVVFVGEFPHYGKAVGLGVIEDDIG